MTTTSTGQGTKKVFTLNTGDKMPGVGLGTWQSKPNEVREAVKNALQMGYRHIDTAAAYGNERQVGQGIRRSGLDRGDVFIETKVWVSDYGHDETLDAFGKATRKLGVDLALNVRGVSIAEAQHELDMVEGFDIGMEMSGQPAAMRDMIANMTHGGRIAMLGLPAAEFPVDWGSIVLKMLTVRGIYGREMFETWYSMSVLLQAGLDLSPVITHKFPAAQYEQAFATARDGQCGKVILDWEA